MPKVSSRAYKGFVPSDELPFQVGDYVALRAGTIIYSCNRFGQIAESFACPEPFAVTIESIYHGADGGRESTATPEHFDPRFCWSSGGQLLCVRFQELLEQGAIPPRQKYT